MGLLSPVGVIENLAVHDDLQRLRCAERRHERGNRLERMLGRLDELDTRSENRYFIPKAAYPAVRDSASYDDRYVAQRQPELMERVELKRKRGLDLSASMADVHDGHRLEDHHLTMKVSAGLDALLDALLVLAAHIPCLSDED